MAGICDSAIEPPRTVHAPSREAWFHALVSGRRRGLGAGLLRAGLSAASVPYGLGVRTRNQLFDWRCRSVHRAGAPVVSIGNLTLGGTGKTPAAEYVARFYRRRARRVAILSRGYGGPDISVWPGRQECLPHRNDEAMVLEENLPGVVHLQGADRVKLARLAVEKLGSEVLVLDDGFQHRRLHRDVDIVLVDATNPWGFGRLFPRGLMREPRSSLRRADLVLLTRCDQVPIGELAELRQEVDRIAPGMEIVESIHAPTHLMNGEEEAPLSLLAERRVAAFCGIGNPEAFRRTVGGLLTNPDRKGGVHMRWLADPFLTVGVSEARQPLITFAAFPDHHAYTRAAVDWLREWARELPPDTLVVTTQKDLVKLRLADLDGRPLWALQIALTPTRGQDALDRKLEGVFT